MIQTTERVRAFPFRELDPNLFRGETSINSGRLPWPITTLATQHFARLRIMG
jgi:hypothetical protein